MENKKWNRIDGLWIHKTDEIQINGVKVDLSELLKDEWNYLQLRSDIVPKKAYNSKKTLVLDREDYNLENKS